MTHPTGTAKALEEALREISDLFGDAVQADCENGVKWLNERAAEAYLADFPATLAAIERTHEIIAEALSRSASTMVSRGFGGSEEGLRSD